MRKAFNSCVCLLSLIVFTFIQIDNLVFLNDGAHWKNLIPQADQHKASVLSFWDTKT